MKKVVHFIITDVFSGAESVAAHIIKNLPPDWQGYYAAPEGRGLETVRAMGVNAIPCNTSDIKDIKRVYNEIMPDAVHAHDPRMSFNCALAGIPFVAHLHNNNPWLQKLCPNSIALRYVCKKAARVLCVSQSIIDEYIFKGSMEKKAEVLHNCVDADEVKSLAAEPVSEKFDLCFVGRMEEEKNPFDFVRIVADLKERLPKVSAVVLGDGALRAEAETLAASLGLSENIAFKGFDRNPYKYMAASKVGVLTSKWEGFGLVAVEQLLLSKPFVAYPVGGLVNIVNDENGKLCRDGSQMCDELYMLLTDGEYYNRKSQAASDSVARFCDRDGYTKRLLEAYSLCGKACVD
ncbi:MAG: glycosyltransferase [Candidatus Avispirillum sp.]